MKDDNSIQNLCLHTHNYFCDGKDSIHNFILSAIKEGVNQIGISSHAPLKNPTKWSMDINKLNEYASEIEKLKSIYQGQISIFTSLEIDFIPNQTFSFDYFQEHISIDYTIGSIHLVLNPENNQVWFIDGDKDICIDSMNRIFCGDPKKAIQAYFNQTRTLIISQQPDIIGHLDKVIMNTSELIDTKEEWYIDEIQKTLDIIKKHGTIVEANTRGLYKGKWHDTFPSTEIMKKCYNMGIPIIISSDAHKPRELTLFYDSTRNKLKKIGFTHQKMRIKDEWCNISL